MTTPRDYNYQDLSAPSHSLRILTLEPGLYRNPLFGSLTVHDLDNLPSYEALSYVWGEHQTTSNFLIHEGGENKILPITRNLELALRRIRFKTEARRVWTDAVCMNQNNADEKNAQIPLMRQIYERAEGVLAYLGEADETSDEALASMDSLQAAVLSTSETDNRVHQWVKNRDCPTDPERNPWIPFQKFMCRPWFQRIWIVQEVVVAQRVTIYCSDWTRDWSIIENSYDTIGQFLLPALELIPDGKFGISREDYDRGAIQASHIREARSAYRRGDHISLMALLYKFRCARAWDIRDQIFALLGLASDSDVEELRPDYSERNDPFTNAERYARYFMQSGPGSERLEVLYRAGLETRSLEGAPSWIPNWFSNYSGFLSESHNSHWNPLDHPQNWKVACSTRPSVCFNTSPGKLRLAGVRIDEIRNLVVSTTWSSFGNVPLQECRRRIGHDLEASDRIMGRIETYPTREKLELVYSKTLICDVAEGHSPAPNSIIESYGLFRRTFAARIDGAARPDDLTYRAYYNAVSDNFNKSFGATNKDYVGMFPTTAQVGDLIFILHGGPVPFVLRPKIGIESEYLLVGQCYVHGIMEGDHGIDLSNPQVITLV